MQKREGVLDSDEIKLLTEVGFLSASRGDVSRSERIFGALIQVRPQRAFAYIGLAVAYMNARRNDDAVLLLERARNLVTHVELGELNAILGLALQLAARRAESVRALEAAGSTGLARVMLGYTGF